MAAQAPDVAIYVEDFEGGGVQAMALRTARELVARGRRVELLVGEAEGVMAANLPPGVPVTKLEVASRAATVACAFRGLDGAPLAVLAAVLGGHDPGAALRHLPALVRYIDRATPRVLKAATPYRGLEALLAKRQARHRPRVVVSEHNDLRQGHPMGEGRRRRHLVALQRRLYPTADAVVAVSQGVAEDVAARSGLARERIAVVYNPAVTPEIARLSQEPVAHPWFAGTGTPVVLAVGRLGAAKDFPMLIRAFARLRAGRRARLVVLGKGKDARKTEKRIAGYRALAAGLGVADDVDFPGFAANPFAWMARASALAVSSRHEGFCSVIAEALACGCPVVSTDCPSGPAEILDGGRYGRLVPVGDEAAMADALGATLDNPPDAATLRQRAQTFSLARAVDRYEELLFGGV